MKTDTEQPAEFRAGEALELLEPAFEALAESVSDDSEIREDLKQEMRVGVLYADAQRHTLGWFRTRALWAARDWVRRRRAELERVEKRVAGSR